MCRLKVAQYSLNPEEMHIMLVEKQFLIVVCRHDVNNLEP